MKMTQGYVTEDGTFWENKLEAQLHEAEMRLRAALSGVYGAMNQELFLEVVLGLMPELWSYINAYQAIQIADGDQQAAVEERDEVEVREEAPPVEGRGFVSPTEKDLTSLLKLPTRGSVHVPDVGSGPRTEKVPDRRKVDGA